MKEKLRAEVLDVKCLYWFFSKTNRFNTLQKLYREQLKIILKQKKFKRNEACASKPRRESENIMKIEICIYHFHLQQRNVFARSSSDCELFSFIFYFYFLFRRFAACALVFPSSWRMDSFFFVLLIFTLDSCSFRWCDATRNGNKKNPIFDLSNLFFVWNYFHHKMNKLQWVATDHARLWTRTKTIQFYFYEQLKQRWDERMKCH